MMSTTTSTAMTTATTGAVLTSTTAPGKIFLSRSEIADHYKSDWHKYNLKRREAGLPLLEEREFVSRWEAAMALKQEKEKLKNGKDHIKKSTTSLSPSKSSKKHHKKTKALRLHEQALVQVVSSSLSLTRKVASATAEAVEEKGSAVENGADDEIMETGERNSSAEMNETQESPEIDPKQSLFDSLKFDTLQENVKYMQMKYGFFIPDQGMWRILVLPLNILWGVCIPVCVRVCVWGDSCYLTYPTNICFVNHSPPLLFFLGWKIECLVDLEGLLGYCHEKVKLGHYCLYCGK
jgi:hypothetical protein